MSDVTSSNRPVAERRDVLTAYQRALNLESHNLAERPLLLAQQLYNQLSFESPAVQRSLADPGALTRDGHHSQPWIRLLTRSAEAGLLRTILLPFTDLVSCVFGADGTTVLAVGERGNVTAWDALSGRKLVAGGFPSKVTVARRNPSSRLLLVGHQDGTLALWDTATGSTTVLNGGHTKQIIDGAFSWHDDTVASLSSDALCLWEGRTGTLLHKLPSDSEQEYRCCALSPDGSEVIVGGAYGGHMEGMSDAVLYRWETAMGSGGTTAHFPGNVDGEVIGCAYTPDGARIIWSRQGWGTGVALSDARLLATLAQGDPQVAGRCRMSPDGITFIMGNGLYDVTTCEKRMPLACTSWAFGPTGTELLLANEDGTLSVWDSHSAKERFIFGSHASRILACDIAPDGRTALSAAEDGVLHVWDFATVRDAGSSGSRRAGAIGTCAYSPDGSVIAGGSKRWLITWDAATGRERESEVIGEVAYQHRVPIPVGSDPGAVSSCQFDSANARLLTAEAGRASVRFAPRFRSGTRFGMDAPDGVTYAALCTDDHTVVTIGGNALTIWLRPFSSRRGDVAKSPLSSRMLYRLTMLTRRARERLTSRRLGGFYFPRSVSDLLFGLIETIETVCIGLALSAMILLCALLRFWCARVARWCIQLRTREQALGACVCGPDGRLVAAGSPAGSVYVWDVRARRQLAVLRVPLSAQEIRLPRHEDQQEADVLIFTELQRAERARAVTRCAFSPDGTILASAHNDGTVRLWNIAAMRRRAGSRNVPLVTLRGHLGAVNGCAITCDGQMILTAGEDRTVRVWDLATCEQRAMVPFASAVTSIAAHPSQLRAVCGDSNGNLHQLEIENTAPSPPVTALPPLQTEAVHPR